MSDFNQKNKKHHYLFVLSFVSVFSVVSTSCSEIRSYNSDTKHSAILPDTDVFNATINSIVSTDVYGREANERDVASSDRKVGMFYFVWLGEHERAGIFDIEKLKSTEDGRKALWSKIDKISEDGGMVADNYTIREERDDNGNLITPTPLFQFHYYSEPLYGYYCSDDPWVLARHVELLTMSGIDYISLDLTNISLYKKNVTAVLETLLKFQQLGWKVPLVTEILTGTTPYTNPTHAERVFDFYNTFYCNSRYDSLWLRDEKTNKPIISIDRSAYYSDLNPLVTANLKINNTIWPYNKNQTQYDDISWLDWVYPQRVYQNSDGNFMSVSTTQHVAGSFGMSVNPYIKDDPNVRTAYAEALDQYDTGAATNYDSNRGRGWDYELNKNVPENAYKGTNLEAQWGNAINNEKSIDEVLVTGWNEWVAYKLPVEAMHGGDITVKSIYNKYYNDVTFCDTADEEFSRDLEMTKGGYGDNFYLQNMRLTRLFKSGNEVKYAGKYATPSLRNVSWENAREYRDFTNEVFARDFDRADHKEGYKYTNNTNRNDIDTVKMSHDDNNLYLQIKTAKNLIIDQEAENNLNVLLSIKGSTSPAWEGYNFILNRTPISLGSGTTKLEAVSSDGEFAFNEVCDCECFAQNNTLSIAIPLINLGLHDVKDFTIDFKVADGMSDPSDIMNYYVDGDSAPIGRLNYRYNSEYYNS